MRGLRLGAVAFLDALGFKGIWERFKPADVLKQMRRLQKRGFLLQGGTDRDGLLLFNDALIHSVRFVSDSIIVAVMIKQSSSSTYPKRPVCLAMFSACFIAADLMRVALGGEPPLLYRGCLSAGLMNIEGDFVIGPAVDEAAEHFERADGPFFWLTKEALRLNEAHGQTFLEQLEPALMIPYAVPLKGGSSIPTLCHNYFGHTSDSHKWIVRRQQIIDTFGAGSLRPDVERKRANTLAFLDHVETIARAEARPTKVLRTPHWEDLTFHQRLSILKHEGFAAANSMIGPELKAKLARRKQPKPE